MNVRLFILKLFCVGSLAVSSVWAFAQEKADSAQVLAQESTTDDETSENSEAAPKVSEATKKTVSSQTEATTFEGSPPGTLPVADIESWKGYLEYLKTREGQAYSIYSIKFAGTVKDDYVDLTATVQVVLNREGEWVDVDLGMKEANLRDTKYEGVGQHSPDEDFTREKGQRWWFKGKGRHQLTLSLIVPIEKLNPARRLTLSVPPAAISELKLTVPISRERLSVVRPGTQWMRITSTGKDKSLIERIGLGRRIGLEWESTPVASRTEKVIQVTTSMLVSPMPAGDSLRLEALQTVRPLEGTISNVTVQLPAEFSLINVEGKQVLKKKVLKGKKILLTLDEPTSESIELKWTMESSKIDAKKLVVIDGFSIDGAGKQSGDIGIGSLNDYRASEQKKGSDFVYRMNANARDWPGNTKVVSAYRFSQQPFRLVLNLEAVEPHFNVQPQLFLYLTDKRAELTAEFKVNVSADSGALQKVELNWPHRIAEGWQIEPSRSTDVVKSIEGRESNDGKLTVHLAKRQTAGFTIQLRAFRVLDAEEKTFDVTLPSASGSSITPTVLVVANAENVTNELNAKLETSLRTASRKILSEVEIPESFDGLRQSTYQIDSVAQELQCQIKTHELQIETSVTTTTSLAEFEHLETKQFIRYNVQYERISQVRLMVPTQLAGDGVVRYSISSPDVASLSTEKKGTTPVTYEPLIPEWTLRDSEGYRQARLTLPQSRIHQFEIKVEYIVDLENRLTRGQEKKVSFPLILSDDAEYSSAIVQFEKNPEIDVKAGNSTLQRQLPDPSFDNWKLKAGTTHDVAFLIRYESPTSSQDYTIRRAWIQTKLDNSGMSINIARYQVEGDVNRIAFTIPIPLKLKNVKWNGLLVANVDKVVPESGQYEFESTSGELSNSLTITYQDPQSVAPKWQEKHKLRAPSFSAGVWMAQTIWEVTLPIDQHLFTQPTGFTPEYSWQRDILFWSRQPKWTDKQLTMWIQDNSSEPIDESMASVGNTYTFSHFGPAGSVSFRSMSQSFIILIGAGVALAFGFILIRIPATRNILTLLTAAFVLSLLSLWFASSVKLLIQPAALGILIAIGANAVDGWLKNRKPRSAFPIPASNDFALPASSPSSFEFHAPYDSSIEESPTVHSRPQSNSGSHTDTGTSFEVGHNA